MKLRFDAALIGALALALFACDEPAEAVSPDAGIDWAPCDAAGRCPQGQICTAERVCVALASVDPQRECAAFSDCLNQCGGQSCADACVFRAPAEALDRYDAVFACLDDGGCFTDQGIDQDCLTQACADDYVACFGALPAQPEGHGTCGDFVVCLNACPSDQCIDDCIRAASPTAVDLFDAAVTCINEAGCPPGDGDCQQENCGEALDACFSHGYGMGTLGCNEALECVFGCPDADCADRCVRALDAEGWDLWGAFVDCAVEAECAGQEACLLACPAEARACEVDR